MVDHMVGVTGEQLAHGDHGNEADRQSEAPTRQRRHLHSRQAGCRWRELDIDTCTRNALGRSLRCLGERGFALLTGRWRAMQRITASSSRIGDIIVPPLS
jgi:hypothetical protein